METKSGHEAVGGRTVKLSEVLSALSYVLDMVEGQPAGHVLRSCFIGMKVAERLKLSVEERSALFYALLLKTRAAPRTPRRSRSSSNPTTSGRKGR